MEVALKLQQWIKKGTLSVMSIKDPSTLEWNEETKKFKAMLSSGSESPQELYFDCVIDGTGMSKELLKSSLLYQQLQDKGCKFNSFGGLEVSPELRVQQTPPFTAPLYAAGAPTTGSVFHTSGIVACTNQAANVAKALKTLLSTK